MTLLSGETRRKLICELRVNVEKRERNKKLNGNVGKLEYNYEWNSAIELLQQSYSRKNWNGLCVLLDLHYFLGWEHHHWNNFLQDENHEKTHQIFLVKVAMSDLFLPILLIPKVIQTFYTDSWLIGGPLGQALCKLSSFSPSVSTAISIQSLVLIAVDRFGAVVFPLHDRTEKLWFSTYQFKAVPVLHSRHLDRRHSC